MNVENILTEELRSVGTNLRTPPPPVAMDLVRVAETRRSRTRLKASATVLIAAAAVLGAVLVSGNLGRQDTAPSPTKQPTVLPTGEPPKISFVKDSALYVGGTRRPGTWAGVLPRRSGSLAFSENAHGTIALFRDGKEVTRVDTQTDLGPVLSPSGTKAAWIQRDGADFSMVAYDLASGRELGRQQVGSRVLGHVGEETEAWESLYEISDAGVVAYGGVLRQHLWTPGSSPVDGTPEPTDEPTGYPTDMYVVLSPDGPWGAWTIDRAGDQPQGTTTTPAQYLVEVAAQKAGEPASLIQFQLPRNSNASSVDWETNGSFLVTVFDDAYGESWHYVRCILKTKRCEVAPTP